MSKKHVFVTGMILFAASALIPLGADDPSLKVRFLGRYQTRGEWDSGAAEISAYCSVSKSLFVLRGDLNRVERIDVSDPENPVLLGSVDLSGIGGSPTSVAARGDLVAVAVAAGKKDQIGRIAFLDPDGALLSSVEVGYLPDMVTFSPDGKMVLAACEGEPADDYTVDPPGSIALVTLPKDISKITRKNVTLLNFDRFKAPFEPGVRIGKPGARAVHDFEPEYIAVSSDSRTAWVILQENNAVAVVDLKRKKILRIAGLGFKDHSLPGNGLDVSDKDGQIDIRPRPVLGMYMPDAIAFFSVNGKPYLITANEGDSRDYDGFSEEKRVKDLKLDPARYPESVARELARLKTTTTMGDANGDGVYEQVYLYGARSFTVWDGSLNQVYDSGDFLERKTAELHPEGFNSQGDAESFDSRSDDKGPEPESVTVGTVGGTLYGFVGLERTNGVMVFNLDNPEAPRFVAWILSADYRKPEGKNGDVSPEGLLFVAASESPTGKALLVVSHEVSGTVTFHELE